MQSGANYSLMPETGKNAGNLPFCQRAVVRFNAQESSQGCVFDRLQPKMVSFRTGTFQGMEQGISVLKEALLAAN
jgi:hypothetical protein